MGCRKPKRGRTTYENRYKRKLNMLWPGQTMLKIVGVFLLMGILFWLQKWRVFASAAFVLAAVVFAVLLILVAIELHQDKVLNEIAMRENANRNNMNSIDKSGQILPPGLAHRGGLFHDRSVLLSKKMGYAFKNGVSNADESGIVRLEKRKER